MNQEEFFEKCDKRFCPRRTTYNEKTCQKEYKRKNCYRRYISHLEKEEEKKSDQSEKDLKWKEVSEEVRKRDGHTCRLSTVLTVRESFDSGYSSWRKDQLEVAHVIRRSHSTSLYYEPRNLVLLHKYFHERLDQYKNPITAESISKEESDLWWERIIGKEEFLWLKNNK